jgi:hypothetical protein
VAIVFPLAVLFGFARTYYLKGFFSSPPVPSGLVHLHGFVMAAWVALFIVQTWLISSRRIRVHRTLGYASIALAVVIILVGFFTALAAAKFGSNSTPPGIAPKAFLIVPLTDLLMFAILFGAALFYRKKAASHKRLILLTMINFLPPAIARWPIPGWMALGPVVFFGIPTLLIIVMLIVDTWKQGKLNRPFAFGAAALILSYPLRLMIMGTDVWMEFACWLT